MWRVSVATELGQGGRVAELARDVHPEVIPASRQSVYWADLGRGLVTDRRTRDQGVQALIHAEQLAPQRIRHDVLVRETVADLLRRAGATSAVVSCAVWPGAWESPPSGELGTSVVEAMTDGRILVVPALSLAGAAELAGRNRELS